ncbi:MAG: hypothetical protein NTY19_05935 [Planctomycetota bacterium]|nr:hypothetical protein [Planctomycetota bacterium]
MYACPYCSHRVQDFEEHCPRCEGNVLLIALLHQLPDVHFNQALKAAQTGDWVTAMQRLGLVLSARPGDREAWLLLGLVFARRGTLDLARDCWNMVLMLQPGEPRASQALGTLRQLLEARPTPEPSA